MVTKNDNSMAVAVHPEECNQLEQERDHLLERFWQVADRIRERTVDMDPEAELPFITEVVEEVRRERYERAQRQAQNGR